MICVHAIFTYMWMVSAIPVQCCIYVIYLFSHWWSSVWSWKVDEQQQQNYYDEDNILGLNIVGADIHFSVLHYEETKEGWHFFSLVLKQKFDRFPDYIEQVSSGKNVSTDSLDNKLTKDSFFSGMILEEFPLPFILKGSSFVNGLYDGLRRPGMTLAGLALLGTGG